jgi:hypothetical protein
VAESNCFDLPSDNADCRAAAVRGVSIRERSQQICKRKVPIWDGNVSICDCGGKICDRGVAI